MVTRVEVRGAGYVDLQGRWKVGSAMVTRVEGRQAGRPAGRPGGGRRGGDQAGRR